MFAGASTLEERASLKKQRNHRLICSTCNARMKMFEEMNIRFESVICNFQCYASFVYVTDRQIECCLNCIIIRRNVIGLVRLCNRR